MMRTGLITAIALVCLTGVACDEPLPTAPEEVGQLLVGSWAGGEQKKGTCEWRAEFRQNESGVLVGWAYHTTWYSVGAWTVSYQLEVVGISGSTLWLDVAHCRISDTGPAEQNGEIDCPRPSDDVGFLSRDEIWLFTPDNKLKRREEYPIDC